MPPEVQLRTEYRSANLVDAEVKGRMFRGYAAVFDTPWNDRLIEIMGYREEVARGAFRKAIASTPVPIPLLVAHERNMVLATTPTTLQLREDGKGLLTQAKLPDNYLGEYAREMIERGDFRGMSYGINLDPRRDVMLTRDTNSGMYTQKVMTAKHLLDVSLTWEPAYQGTTVELLRSSRFVATPLQELLDGTEAQIEDGGNGEPPDDGKPDAWWGEEPTEAEGEPEPATSRKWWESYLDELEREV
jgi:HK97 family phage prohead protease